MPKDKKIPLTNKRHPQKSIQITEEVSLYKRFPRILCIAHDLATPQDKLAGCVLDGCVLNLA